jgi:hypothetical protein
MEKLADVRTDLIDLETDRRASTSDESFLQPYYLRQNLADMQNLTADNTPPSSAARHQSTNGVG